LLLEEAEVGYGLVVAAEALADIVLVLLQSLRQLPTLLPLAVVALAEQPG
jgi:hypothetical protein